MERCPTLLTIKSYNPGGSSYSGTVTQELGERGGGTAEGCTLSRAARLGAEQARSVAPYSFKTVPQVGLERRTTNGAAGG